MTKPLLLALCATCTFLASNAQSCTPLGNQTSYGSADVWIGYIYDNEDFTAYAGYVNEGVSGNPTFNEGFGGANVTYPTNGCGVSTTNFSARYKLNKTFAPSNYTFTVGADDGYRLSVDGGATWLINKWAAQSYNTTLATVYLSGSVNLVLEYYEASGDNSVSFAYAAVCTGPENQATFGTGNTWNGYLYDGMNFDVYAGMVTKGTASNPNFTENFGGDAVTYATSACGVYTETFSARYRLTKTYASKMVTFTVNGDDGYRLSLDGGTTWVINQWSDHGNNSTSYTVMMNGTFNLVLEYYENGGQNVLGFTSSEAIVLPIRLISFNGKRTTAGVRLDWQVVTDELSLQARPQRSTDGLHYATLANIEAPASSSHWSSSYTDRTLLTGRTWYRLEMIGESGDITYSPVFVVSGNDLRSSSITLFPTMIAAGGSFCLLTDEGIDQPIITITDLSGKIVVRQVISALPAGQPVHVFADGLGSGLYLVSVTGKNGNRMTQKLVIR